MVEPEGGTYVLNLDKTDQIVEKYGEEPPQPEEFLPSVVTPLSLQENFGIRDPSPLPDFDVTGSTTFTELYTAQYTAYEFPLRNLQRNQCVG